ncbi:PAAR domain-containing protein [Paenibacillus naphthalenovorans]|uniref:PAAR domain-containing protein n=1 Tax=Paenibacillus naphthalenovorans TaxID=162209 RepID=UPI0011A22950
MRSYACGCGQFGCSTCYEYSSGTVSGSISNGASNVYINGSRVAINGSVTTESVMCPSGFSAIGGSSGSGSVTATSRNVFINGVPIACKGDTVRHFSGNGTVTSGSNTVLIV